MTCNFHVGQKVVCIDDNDSPPKGHQVLTVMVLPKVGKVYTVREVLTGVVGGSPCVLLQEIPDQIVEVLSNGVHRVGTIVFYAHAFRPLVERKTDISIFKAMLTPKTEQVAA
jgi:hypothetical protein